MTATVYMIRHAESVYKHGEERSRGLSEKGLRDALRVRELLAKEEIHLVFSSSYVRAVQTVQPLADAKGLPVQLCEEFRERSIAGDDVAAAWEQVVDAMRRSFTDEDYALPGGESANEACRRAVPAMEELLMDFAGKRIAVGTHGRIMSAMLHQWDANYGFDFWQNASMPDVYKLSFDGGRLVDVERMWTPEAE